MKQLLLSATLLVSLLLNAQPPLYNRLPVGRYPVGFSIITFTDSSRVNAPGTNYLGEKMDGDRLHKITVHLWYPANAAPQGRRLQYGEYGFNHLNTATNATLSAEQRQNELVARRRAVERWFGRTTDTAWARLQATPAISVADAAPAAGKFPVLIGMLRPLSTTLTNEMLASNGYIVAMVKNSMEASFAESALTNIPDMQQALRHLSHRSFADVNKLGVFGFSGSGFTPLLFALHDKRAAAFADLESGFYMNELFQALSASNYYKPSALRIPYLHIFSRDLSKQEAFINELEGKTRFAQRYRLLLNQPALHHWDFASEGYTACRFLGNRGEAKERIERSFEIANHYLLQFFNANLKHDEAAVRFLQTRPALTGYDPSLWDIISLPATKPAPTSQEFALLVEKKGFDEALRQAKATLPTDSSSNLWQGFLVNRMAYDYLGRKQYKEAIGLFVLNTELHPSDPNTWDSLSEAYEASGDAQNMKQTAEKLLAFLNTKAALNDFEKSLKANAEKRLK